MRTIAFLTQKGGAGKTTLAASLAVAAAGAGERVIVLDLDPQASLARWGKRREAANVPSKVMIDQLEGERLPRLGTFLEGLNDAGFTNASLQPVLALPEPDTYVMVLGSARPLLEALQHATTELQKWLMADYGFTERGAQTLMGQTTEYEIANVVDPNFTVVAKIRKTMLPRR